VRDTGIGIPPERLDRLFKAFSQVDASISRTYGGTGLGLAICQRLVGLMGGEIAVTSTPGKGSDFHFTLPMTAADVTEELRNRSLAAAGEFERVLRDRRILVVDDLEPNRRLLERMLEQYGASVRLTRSAAEAMAEIEATKFDLAILDYMMIEQDGLALAKQIRAHREGRELPLVLVTSVKLERESGAEQWFDSVLLKPVRYQPFVAAAARALMKGRVPATRVTEAAQPTTAFGQKYPLHLAVVDDNPVNLKVIAAMLRSLGYAPTIFNEATIALSRWREEKFDVILMDVQMPTMDGIQATRELRAGAAGELNRRTRVIALTAGAMAEERAACLAAGMDDFMAKPVPRAELMEKLAAAHAALAPVSS
jgi:CheY-like chemotaxis protein